MANNVSVKISADVADLTAKRAVMSAELKAATKDLNAFAKEAAAGNGTDELRAGMLAAADAVSKAKAQISAVDQEVKAFSATQRSSSGLTSQQRAGMQQLGYQLGDVATMFSLGARPAQIFASQIGQVTQAVQIMTGGTSKAAAFLGGPWGIGLALATTVLAPFVAKLFEGRDALEKETQKLRENAEQARIAEDAKRAFARTEAGAADDVRKMTDALQKQNDALHTNAELQNIRAKASIATLNREREGIAKQLADAKRDLAEARAAAGRSGDPESMGASGRAAGAAERVAELERRLAGIDKTLAEANANYQRTRADLAGEAAGRAVDPIAAIRYKYEGERGLIEQAKQRALAEGTVTSELTKQITALKQRMQAEIEAEQKRQRGSRGGGSSGLSGREVSSSEAKSIAEGAGFRVTSADRSYAEQQRLYNTVRTAENPVAKPGTSAHERGGALDIAFGAGVTPQSIRAAFDKEGVRLTKLLKEAGHYHIEWSTAGADRAQKEADRERERDAAEVKRLNEREKQTANQLTVGNADATLSLQKIDLADRRRAIEALYADERIGAEEKAAYLTQLAEEEAAAEIAAQEAKKQAYAGDVVAVQAAANQERVIRANLAAQISEIERQRTEDQKREAARRLEDERKANREREADWRDTNNAILSAESQLIRGIFSGRQSLGQILQNIALQTAENVIEADLRELTMRQLYAAEGIQIEAAAAQRGFLVHAFGEKRKTAVAAAGEAARTTVVSSGQAAQASVKTAGLAAHAAGEVTKTGATIAATATQTAVTIGGETAKAAAVAAGQAAQVGATAAGTAAKAGIVGASNAKEIISHAATAAAAAYKALAGVPVIGPILGAAAATVTFAAVTAYGALASFDKGANVIPNDMIAQIHAGERIIPAADNRAMMAAISRGTAGDSAARGDVHLHYSPALERQNRPLSDQLWSHADTLVTILHRAHRDGKLKFS